MSVIAKSTHDVHGDSGNIPKVEISEDASGYILDKGGIITLMLGRAFGFSCCADNVCEPVVFAGKSRLPEIFYNEVLTNGIKVYISKGVLVEPDGIKISLGNLRGVPTLEVEGIITY
ncbi:CC/Se motif family (seleno)protein [Sporotomaculum syntrophicum]|uniref:CC/Se motif family (seleno)protein n=1 Tax=Sporotomaculum syntrophicum TaxID=182264 RepID=UPI00137ACDDF|nr:CC/Se motif family (seleno)protein [Sporotomaculum syntrophicum]